METFLMIICVLCTCFNLFLAYQLGVKLSKNDTKLTDKEVDGLKQVLAIMTYMGEPNGDKENTD